MKQRLYPFSLLLFLSSCLCAEDSLVDSLTQGKFSGNIDAHYEKGTDVTAHQKIFLEYDLPKIDDVDLKFGVQSLKHENKDGDTSNQTFYSEAIYAQSADLFDYELSAIYFGTLFSQNSQAQNVLSQAVGLKATTKIEDVTSYVAISKVSDNGHQSYTQPSINGQKKALPAGSLLLSNNDSSGTNAAAIDMQYRIEKGVAIGTRYSASQNNTQFTSYSGVYSSFALKSLSEKFNVTLSYDKALQNSDAQQVSLQFKNHF